MPDVGSSSELIIAVQDAMAGMVEAVRVMDLMGRGADARALALCNNNLRAALRSYVASDEPGPVGDVAADLLAGWDTGTDATETP